MVGQIQLFLTTVLILSSISYSTSINVPIVINGPISNVPIINNISVIKNVIRNVKANTDLSWCEEFNYWGTEMASGCTITLHCNNPVDKKIIGVGWDLNISMGSDRSFKADVGLSYLNTSWIWGQNACRSGPVCVSKGSAKINDAITEPAYVQIMITMISGRMSTVYVHYGGMTPYCENPYNPDKTGCKPSINEFSRQKKCRT